MSFDVKLLLYSHYKTYNRYTPKIRVPLKAIKITVVHLCKESFFNFQFIYSWSFTKTGQLHRGCRLPIYHNLKIIANYSRKGSILTK
jgi:hypothetical protein